MRLEAQHWNPSTYIEEANVSEFLPLWNQILNKMLQDLDLYLQKGTLKYDVTVPSMKGAQMGCRFVDLTLCPSDDVYDMDTFIAPPIPVTSLGCALHISCDLIVWSMDRH